MQDFRTLVKPTNYKKDIFEITGDIAKMNQN